MDVYGMAVPFAEMASTLVIGMQPWSLNRAIRNSDMVINCSDFYLIDEKIV